MRIRCFVHEDNALVNEEGTEGWADDPRVMDILHSGGAYRDKTHFEALLRVTPDKAAVSFACV